MIKVLLKTAANKTMATIAKKVPFYGIIFGVVFAVNRVARNRKSPKGKRRFCRTRLYSDSNSL